MKKEPSIIKNYKDLTSVTDIYGIEYQLDLNKNVMQGGQGVIVRTENPNIVLKIGIINSNGDLKADTEGNSRYNNIRLLPIESNWHISMPKSILKDYNGYVMRLLEDMEDFRSHFEIYRSNDQLKTTEWINSLFSKDISEEFSNYYSTGGKRRRLEAMLKSGAILAQLHSRGLVYSDYKPENMLISSSKDHCNVWMIDADNIRLEKNAIRDSYPHTVGFAAPEVLQLALEQEYNNISMDEKWGSGNSLDSDTYSYALCLFKYLAFCHPFEGETYWFELENCDSREEIDIRKDNGRFRYIDDIDNNNVTSEDEEPINRNRFFDDIVEYAVTTEIRSLFQDTFSTNLGKYCSWLRPSMFEYVHALAKALDNVINCTSCGMDFFINNNDNKIIKCPWCENSIEEVLKLKAYYLVDDEKGELIWDYTHELNGSLKIPLRIINGFFNDEIDDIFMYIEKVKNEFCIEMINHFNIDYKLSTDNSNYIHANKYRFSSTRFYIKVVNKYTNTEIFIEGEDIK